MCAKLILRVYLFFYKKHRGPNESNIPYDAWIRLTDKLVKQ